MKHVIIGAGISGISLAYHLQQLNKDDEIIIIEKDILNTTSMHSNNLYILKDKIKNKKDLIKKRLGIQNFPFSCYFFVIHFILINIFFFYQIKTIQSYFSKMNCLPIKKNKCNDILIYNFEDYDTFVHSFTIQKGIFVSYKKMKDDKIMVKIKDKDSIVCDYFYDCTANAQHPLLIQVGSFSVYVKVKEIKINCLHRNGIYWLIPYKKNIIKVSFNLNINKKNISTDIINDKNIKEIIKKYDMEVIEIKKKWYGNRTCSLDLIPYYQQKSKNTFKITGGSFLGFNVCPFISKKVALIVNKKKIPNELKRFDLSIHRIYKKIIFCYLLIFIYILYKKKLFFSIKRIGFNI